MSFHNINLNLRELAEAPDPESYFNRNIEEADRSLVFLRRDPDCSYFNLEIRCENLASGVLQGSMFHFVAPKAFVGGEGFFNSTLLRNKPVELLNGDQHIARVIGIAPGTDERPITLQVSSPSLGLDGPRRLPFPGEEMVIKVHNFASARLAPSSSQPVQTATRRQISQE